MPRALLVESRRIPSWHQFWLVVEDEGPQAIMGRKLDQMDGAGSMFGWISTCSSIQYDRVEGAEMGPNTDKI